MKLARTRKRKKQSLKGICEEHLMSFGHEHTHELTLEGEDRRPLIIVKRKNQNENRSDHKMHAKETIVFA